MQVAPSGDQIWKYATNSSATEINLEIFNLNLPAGKIIQVIEAMPGSVVPLAG